MKRVSPTHIEEVYGIRKDLILTIRLIIVENDEVPIAPYTNRGEEDKVQGRRRRVFFQVG